MELRISTMNQEIALKTACMTEDKYAWLAMVNASKLSRKHHRKIVRTVWQACYRKGIWRLQQALEDNEDA